MSEERRKRKQEREQQDQPRELPKPSLKVIVILAILVVAASGVTINWYRQSHRLDAFAQCLTAKGAKMYGAFWCPHCAEQKELFGASFKYAPYIECGIKGSQGIAQVCTDNGVKRFPTWVYPDGTRTEGKRSLDYLSEETSCPLP
jgi:hypothetical protein